MRTFVRKTISQTKEHKIMKNLQLILAALVLLGIAGCTSTGKNKEAAEAPEVAAVAEDTAAVANAAEGAPAELSEAARQESQAKKAFLETFYDGLKESGFDDAYIRKFITPNAKKILIDENPYECESGDCLAVWLFAYEGGADTGPERSRTIKEQDENRFLVNIQYEEEEYNVLLTVVKDGDTYKIDNIEKK